MSKGGLLGEGTQAGKRSLKRSLQKGVYSPVPLSEKWGRKKSCRFLRLRRKTEKEGGEHTVLDRREVKVRAL